MLFSARLYQKLRVSYFADEVVKTLKHLHRIERGVSLDAGKAKMAEDVQSFLVADSTATDSE